MNIIALCWESEGYCVALTFVGQSRGDGSERDWISIDAIVEDDDPDYVFGSWKYVIPDWEWRYSNPDYKWVAFPELDEFRPFDDWEDCIVVDEDEIAQFLKLGKL